MRFGIVTIGLAVAALVALNLGGCAGTALVDDPNTTTADPNATTTDANNTTGTSARAIQGQILTSAAAKARLRWSDTEPAYSVIVQSTDTLKTYTAQTDSTGEFQVNLPEGTGNETFTVHLITPEGKPAGPVILQSDSTQGSTGLVVDGTADLGTIDFPDDPAAAPITPGTDSNVDSGAIDGDVVARLNDDGVPVGVPTYGRGSAAQGTASSGSKQRGDCDQDGLIDMIDADDDGDGTVDNFDPDADLDAGIDDGLIVNFFMNLKIDDVQATPYFSGDTAGIEASLKTNTVITFEVRANASLGKNIKSCRIIAPPAPAPAYLPSTTIATSNPPAAWSSTSYALQPDGTNHFQEWVVPNDFMNTGDTFTVEITFDDGTVGVYSRMINYVFKSIPKLINVGAPGALAPFNGPAKIQFDGSQDLTFEWAPPVDDFGMLIVGVPYRFEIFYYDTSGNQINNIDASSWSTAIPNFDPNGACYEVAASSVTTLSASNTFTVTLPKEIFVNSVTVGGSTVNVGSYKVDIAAQNNGNNAALMLRLKKK